MGGRFTQTSDGSVTDLGRIARYDTASNTWATLANQGLNEEVTALAMVGSDIYVGGIFTQTVDGSVNKLGSVAHYNPTTDTWNALPNQGLSGQIFALAALGNDLFVGGTFDKTGDGAVNLSRIAHYDTSNPAWAPLPNQGLNGSVYAMATNGSNLYVGGGFTKTGNGVDLNHIARYDTVANTWNALPNQGLNGDVTALAVSGSDLYVGGIFTQTIDGTVTDLGNIAHYDMTSGTWSALHNHGLDGQVFVIAVVGNDLYVGGAFDQTGDGAVPDLGYIARYDLTNGTWNALPNQGLSNWVYVLTAFEGDLYVGGEFNCTGDGSINLSHIARFGSGDTNVYLPLVIRP
jgi:N-acetylneuraminic acid mutarotase